MSRWFDEALHDGYALRLRAETVLCERDTGHQRLAVFETALFGRALMLDDIVQTTERDEFIYHEMIVHVPLLAHGAARRVLVIGGGDGGAIEEILKHRAVEHVRLVELDAELIDHTVHFRTGESHGQQHQIAGEFVLRAGNGFE